MTGVNLINNYVREISNDKEQLRQLVRAVNRIINESIPNVTTVSTTTYNVNTGDDIINGNAVSAAIAINLLDPKVFPNADLLVVKTDASTNAVSVVCTGSGVTFGDGTTSKSITTRGESFRLINDGVSGWFTRRGS